MEDKIVELSKKALEIMGKDSDFLILCHKEGRCGGIFNGDSETIGESLFAHLHASGNNMRDSLYQIIKNNVANILKSESIYKNDLIKTIYSSLPENEN